MTEIWMVFLFSLVFNGPGVFATCPKTAVKQNGECYKISNARLPSNLAHDHCENETGLLAGYPFYEYLTSSKLQSLPLSNGNCYWVGDEYTITYFQENAAPISSLWGALQMVKFMLGQMNVDKECPVICRRGSLFNLDMVLCSKQLPFVCSFEETVVVQKKRPVGNKSYKTVVIRIEEHKSIIGEPEFTLTVPLPTMCSRICLKSKTCKLFNFNTVSNECSGYSTTITYREDPFWQVWAVKKV